MSTNTTESGGQATVATNLIPNMVARRIEKSVEELGADVVLTEIRRNCFIIYVTVRAWRGNYLMKQGETVIDGRKVDEKLTTRSHWRVMPDKWHKALQPFESKCRSAVYRLGVTFKDGVYIVPKLKAKVLVDEIKRIREEYKAKAEEFANEWPDIVRELEQKITSELGQEQWSNLSKLLPSAQHLPKLFDIEIGLWPIGSSSGVSIECFEDLERAAHHLDAVRRLTERLCGTADSEEDRENGKILQEFTNHISRMWEKAQRMAKKVVEEHVEDWLGEVQSTTNRMVAAAVEAMISEPIKEFTEQVDNLAKLSQSGTVRAGTLDAVRRAYRKLIGFQFMLPPDLLQQLKQVELRLGTASPKAINCSQVGQQLNDVLRSIRDELNSDMTQLKAFGQLTRHLDI